LAERSGQRKKKGNFLGKGGLQEEKGVKEKAHIESPGGCRCVAQEEKKEREFLRDCGPGKGRKTADEYLWKRGAEGGKVPDGRDPPNKKFWARDWEKQVRTPVSRGRGKVIGKMAWADLKKTLGKEKTSRKVKARARHLGERGEERN